MYKNISLAYKSLKDFVYYERLNLGLRKTLAEFEANMGFPDNLYLLQESFDALFVTNQNENSDFSRWLENIEFMILPKNFKEDNGDEKDNFVFLSNRKTKIQYEVERVSFFINSPIEIFLLSTLWCKNVGLLLDRELDENCMGNRLANNGKSPTQIFKYYINQYNGWRDSAIEKGITLLNQNEKILLIALDIKDCYYSITVDWEIINDHINNSDLKKDEKAFFIILNESMKRVHERYHKKIESYLSKTHPTLKDVIGIPIGLPSSGVLANWELKKLDKRVNEVLHPIHYGRYVDDILILLHNPNEKYIIKKSDDLYKELLSNIVVEDKDNLLKIEGFNNLFLQKKKLIFHYYDDKHSIAGLTEFRRELLHQISEFKFLPLEDEDKELDQCVYSLRFGGPVNKLRNLIGIDEDDTELLKFLSKKIIENRLCFDSKPKKEIIDQFFKFFMGQNTIEYYRTWEKSFSFLLIYRDKNFISKYYEVIFEAIKRVRFNINDEKTFVSDKVIEDLKNYLILSISLPLGLFSEGFNDEKFIQRELTKISNFSKADIYKKVLKISQAFRKSNLIWQMYLSWPLISYTNFRGNIFYFERLNSLGDFQLDDLKLEYSPCHIHYDDFQLIHQLKYLKNIDHKNDAFDYYFSNSLFDGENYYKLLREKVKFIEENLIIQSEFIRDKHNPNEIVIKEFQDKDKDYKNILIGIANMKVAETSIKASYQPTKKPDLTFKRQANLFELINEALKEPECDLVVFPEVSVPYSWLPFMVYQARRKNIGMVFGLEHWVLGNKALNFVATILPFSTEGGYHACFESLRLKNYYSPAEEEDLANHGLSRPKVPIYYEKYFWRNAAFTVFNCFELTNIADRSLFKLGIDFAIAVEWNPDTNYFSNLVESAIRDLHCFFIQVNTSNYGDSRVSSPKKTEQLNMVRVTGGENQVLLKANLLISHLRDFQLKNYTKDIDEYKPLPAGLNSEEVILKRIQKAQQSIRQQIN